MKITVGVVGLGLIGASFCKAYKANEPEAVVYGWNRTKSTVEMAKMQGIIDDELTIAEQSKLLQNCLPEKAPDNEFDRIKNGWIYIQRIITDAIQ